MIKASDHQNVNNGQLDRQQAKLNIQWKNDEYLDSPWKKVNIFVA
ncbi:hypothetical protein [Polynucleobacter sp. MWH-HuK1]|nr:hypothetical protein [Polynucleobacter sp. MWH-HuK1]